MLDSLRCLLFATVAVLLTTLAEGQSPIVPVAVPDLSNAERILLPSYNCYLPGVDGARWCTGFSVFNGNGNDVVLYPYYPHRNGGFISGVLLPARTYSGIRLLQSIASSFTETAPRSARLVYVDRAMAPSLSFHLRVFDESRLDFDGGTEVPVVRDSELLQVVNLAPITLDPRFRVALRIYDPSRRDMARVSINIYDALTGQLLANRVAELDVFERTFIQNGVQHVDLSFPGLAEYLDLRASFPELSDVAPESVLRIEIVPAEPSLRIWAMVSELNIDTHHVTLVTPQ